LTTKVIVLSADIQDRRKDECMELGAALFVEKPLSPAKLAQLLANLAS